MNIFKSGWFYVVSLLILLILTGIIWHKCSIDSLKENNNKLLQQLLEDSNFQAKKIDDTLYAIRTIQNNQISKELLTEKMQKIIDENNLSEVYASQIQLQASINKIINGQSGPTTIIPRENNNKPSSTIIITRETNGQSNTNNNSCSNNNDIHNDNQHSPEDINVCNQCLSGNIIRVPFETQEGFLKVFGWTETGTAIGESGTYHLDVSWIKDIELSILLSQNEDGLWETLVDSNDPDVQISRIRSEITVMPFEQKWWQKLQMGVGIGFGAGGALLNGLFGYRITNHLNILGSFWYDMAFDGTIENYNDHAYYGLLMIGNL